MNKPAPRRSRGASTRKRVTRRSALTTATNRSNQEGLNMNAQLMEPDIRLDLVARIRREIRDGVYDTPEKFEAALTRLSDNIRFS
jgi:anti-sigma28 factor (negative regulator of flagellin synthesis)